MGDPTTARSLAEPSSAKLQVLYLPEEKVGEVSRYPFALVLSEVAEELDEAEIQRWREFRDRLGAVAVLLTPRKIEVV